MVDRSMPRSEAGVPGGIRTHDPRIRNRMVKTDIEDGDSVWSRSLIAGTLADAKRIASGVS
jgi:hypothetical protein